VAANLGIAGFLPKPRRLIPILQLALKLKWLCHAPFFQQLLEWRTPLRGGKRKAADALTGYVAPRQEMICYQQCDEKGWDVGSGPMERCAA